MISAGGRAAGELAATVRSCHLADMDLVLRIPDDIAARLRSSRVDLEREALEDLVVEKFRAGRIEVDDVRNLLGFASLDQVDGFLKAHGAYEAYRVEELEDQVRALARLGY